MFRGVIVSNCLHCAIFYLASTCGISSKVAEIKDSGYKVSLVRGGYGDCEGQGLMR